MLTQTTITAIRALIYIGLKGDREPLSIRHVAAQLGESPSYLAKVARQLVKAGILKAHHGVMGGVALNRPTEVITLLAIVEACQGAILADFCQATSALHRVCAFHVAAAELHEAIVGSLSRWTLSQLVACPGPSGRGKAVIPCLLRQPAPEPAGGSGSHHEREPAGARRSRLERLQKP